MPRTPLALLLLVLPLAAEDGAPAGSAATIRLDLDDGSTLLGTLEEPVRIRTVLGTLAVPPGDVEEILPGAKVRPAAAKDRVSTAAGDILVGTLETAAFRLRSGGAVREVPRGIVRLGRAEAPSEVRWVPVRPRKGGEAVSEVLSLRPGERLLAEPRGAVFAGPAGTWRSPAEALLVVEGEKNRPASGVLSWRPEKEGEADLRPSISADPGNAGAFRVRLTRSPAAAAPAAAAAASGEGFRRVGPGAFGPEAATLDFDRRPDGTALAYGNDLTEVFRPRGVTLASLVPNTFVGADNYTVDSKSHGLSCAINSPQWTGDFSIDFEEGGPDGQRPGVRRAGFYVAAVSPGGTGLRAFAADGTVLGEVLTTGSGTDFLGVESDVPISRIVAFAVPAIDPNFTIDDLSFEWAEPAAAGDVLALSGGTRLVGEAIGFEKGAVRFRWALAKDAEPFAAAGVDRLIVRPPKGRSPKASWQVFLPGGGSIGARGVGLREHALDVQAAWAAPIEIPREMASLVRRLEGAALPEPSPRPGRDAGRVRLADGRAVDGDPLTFDEAQGLSLREASGKRYDYPASEVREILLGDRPDPPDPEVLLTTRDGSLLPGTLESLDRKTARVNTIAGSLEIPRAEIRWIEWVR